MRKHKPKTDQTTPQGKQVPVAVETTNDLLSAIRENFSPQTVAAFAAHLRAASTKDDDVNRQIQWFTQQLINLLGASEYNRLIEEVGL